ncbi:hypothetical protein FACS1894184_15330 [Clostridia bacterium]|nr:hypothetical protein FACS1894184_15330 [Clostridia bacterium]
MEENKCATAYERLTPQDSSLTNLVAANDKYNISKIVSCNEQIIRSTEHTSSTVYDSFNLINKMAKPLLNVYSNSFTDKFSTLSPLLEATNRYISGIPKSVQLIHKYYYKMQIHELLKEHGWFYLDGIAPFIEEIIDNDRTKDCTTEEINKMICNFYRKDKCKAISIMLSKWLVLDCFNTRSKTLRECIICHEEYLFNVLAHTLIGNIEGIIYDFYTVKYSKASTHYRDAIVREAISKIKDMSFTNISLIDYVFASGVINYIEGDYREHFENLPVNNLSRHQMEHGAFKGSISEVESIKLFLYLDGIFTLLQALDKAYQRNKQTNAIE